MAYYSFESLAVWKRACTLSVSLYGVLNDCKDYGLKDQMTRAAISIPSNIAEDSERGSIPEFIRFLNIAKGSAAELWTQIIIVHNIGILSESTEKSFSQKLFEISSMLGAFIKTLKQKINSQPATL